MKNLRHLFTALLLLCCGIATAHDFNVSGIYYNITDETNKTVKVTYRGDYYSSYNNEYTGDVVIPESVTYNSVTYSVTSIGYHAFMYCPGLTSITIPNSVTSIGYNAFGDCSGLESITIGNSVTSIGYCAFSGCEGLTRVELHCTSVGSWFSYETSIKEIVIGNEVTSIGGDAFRDCSGLTSITIPNSVTSIGNNAFKGCSGLTSITIPNSVKSIGYNAFYGCSGLTSVTIPNSVTSIGYCAFENCYGLTNVTIPNSVTSIGERAFNGCSGLTSITIPSSITSIGDRAFFDCSGLTSITIPNSVTSIGNRAFAGCEGLTSIIVESGNSKYDSRENCNAIIETESNTLIAGCKNTIIPSSVTSIGGAFYGYSGLTSITIPNSVKSIGYNAFYGCSGLTSITIPNSVTRIGGSAFYGCSGLTSITIPNSVTSIGDNAFCRCENLRSATISSSVTKINQGVFSRTGLTSITIPEGVVSLGAWAFDNSPSLAMVSLPSTLESIAGTAFEACEKLKTVINLSNLTFTKGSTDYGYVAYYADKVINAPNGAVIGDYVFSKPNNQYILTEYLGNEAEIVLPENCNGENYIIGESSFKGNTSLKSITIPKSVQLIKKNAFEGCESLKTLYVYGNKPPLVEEGNFTNEQFLDIKLYVPAESMSKYETADTWENFFNVEELVKKEYLYTITLTVDGNVHMTLQLEAGSAIPVIDKLIKEGYTFEWVDVPSTMPAKDITITGSFTVNSYTVTYMVDGEEYKTETIEYGAEITLPIVEEKEGYTFEWIDAPSTMPAKDITITGSFTVNSYTVTYMINGEEYKTETIEYGAEITLPIVEEKEGYTFEWVDAPATMPAENITIEGKYIADAAIDLVELDPEKVVIYDLNGHRILDKESLTRGLYIINGKKVLVK